ncbi:SHOCT domain-containing protein [Floridanema evergladense]|uniref:SHOCT domain-containing protein n=1 Tax=Floridaenema evergladense BLCC-F167 TaxID=3153639 RepID=A0ABV4WVM2_9CYAN
MLSTPKNRKLAAFLAFSGTLVPLAGLHKFYLGQPLWGILYLSLSWTPIPRVASAIEGFWYLVQDSEEFDRNFNAEITVSAKSTVDPQNVTALADALRQLESLRQEGLISDYEFEQKRRQLLNI